MSIDYTEYCNACRSAYTLGELEMKKAEHVNLFRAKEARNQAAPRTIDAFFAQMKAQRMRTMPQQQANPALGVSSTSNDVFLFYYGVAVACYILLLLLLQQLSSCC